jgi:hypothetical protein
MAKYGQEWPSMIEYGIEYGKDDFKLFSNASYIIHNQINALNNLL